MHPQTLTTDTLLLQTGVLHRVDTRQMPADAGVSFGAMCTQNTPQQEPSAYDLKGMDYSDHHGPRTMAERDRCAKFWRRYLLGVAVGLLALAAWLLA